jgi:hypothetical protein
VFEIWKQYGDEATAEAYFDAVAAQQQNVSGAFSSSSSSSGGNVDDDDEGGGVDLTSLSPVWGEYGDWCPPPSTCGANDQVFPTHGFPSAFSLVRTTQQLAVLAKALGRSDAQEWASSAEKLVGEFKTSWLKGSATRSSSLPSSSSSSSRKGSSAMVGIDGGRLAAFRNEIDGSDNENKTSTTSTTTTASGGSGSGGVYDQGLQTNQVLGLTLSTFGMINSANDTLSDEDAQALAVLMESLDASRHHLHTGILGARFMFDLLLGPVGETVQGTDETLDILQQIDYPSYGCARCGCCGCCCYR